MVKGGDTATSIRTKQGLSPAVLRFSTAVHCGCGLLRRESAREATPPRQKLCARVSPEILRLAAPSALRPRPKGFVRGTDAQTVAPTCTVAVLSASSVPGPTFGDVVHRRVLLAARRTPRPATVRLSAAASLRKRLRPAGGFQPLACKANRGDTTTSPINTKQRALALLLFTPGPFSWVPWGCWAWSILEP